VKNINKFNLIKFYAFQRKSDKDLINPIASILSLPDWYLKAKKFSSHGVRAHNEDGKSPTFKGCISFLDSMSLGYFILSPVDIIVQKNGDEVEIEIDHDFNSIFQFRPEMKGFNVPDGFYKDHIALVPQWGVSLPEGYSALYVTPLNRFELPFVITSGVIENDKIFTPGAIPIFINKNFSGIIKKGTPLIQVIPFKRENWESEIVVLPHEESQQKLIEDGKRFRSKTGYYMLNYWVRKIFK